MRPDADSGPAGDLPASPGASGDAQETRVAPRVDVAPRWWVVLGVILLDQSTKLLITMTIPLFGSRPLIPGFVDLVHVQNRGVAFGIFNDAEHPLRGMGTIGLAVLALAGIAYYARQLRPEEHVARLGLALILGGAVGNLFDRIRQGYVTDFVDVYWRDWHFWAFNAADAAITVGAVLVFVDLLIPRHHASRSL